MSSTNNDLYQLVEIGGEHYLYNKKDDTYQSINVQFVEEENKENNVEQVSETVTTCEEKKIWTNESTLALINLYEQFDEQFQTSIKKHVWIKISKILTDKFGTSITWQQCDTKWKGLLKIYKDTKEHNATSGKKRRRWEYFEAMNKILHEKPEITPVATCSSMAGLEINNELSSSENMSDDPKIQDEKNSNSNKRKCSSTYISSFSKKRSATVAAERRHQEKMQRQDNFIKCFNDYIELLRNKENKND